MIATLFANTSEPWPLCAGTVHVWRFACRQPLGDLVHVLSETERVAAARFVRDEHGDAYRVQHAMLRCLIARYVERAPAALELGLGPHGKPFVVNREGLEFNLSHAADVALLAVARGMAVGVDLERLDAELDPASLQRLVLAPDELAAAGDRGAFLRVWCRKEACLKATGVGLIDDLPSVSVAGDRVHVGNATVHVRDLDIGPAHAAALATTVACAPVGPAELETFTA